MYISEAIAGVFLSDGQQPKSDVDRLLESIAQYYDNYIDPREALRDDDTGELWKVLGSGDWSKVADTEETLRAIRNECRTLAVENEFAINGHENRISYIVGSGHEYDVEAKDGREVSDDDIEEAQAVIDEFIEASKWQKRQQEIVRRKDRDGECFLRLIEAPGSLAVRFIEPGQVASPVGANTRPNESFGIITEPDDVESIVAYWVDGECVPAAQVQHRKQGVDFNVKRGLPLFYPVRKNLKRAAKLLRNMSVVVEVQSAIAMIRKRQASQSTVENMIRASANASAYDSTTGQTRYFRRYGPGTIIDANMGDEYEFPSNGLDASRVVTVLQAELRAVASRLVMPEFMLTSDASNANYSSTMVAEGPAVKMFQRLQWDMIADDEEIMARVLDQAVAVGRISPEVRASIVVNAQPPGLETRDKYQESQVTTALVASKIMSKYTARMRHDLDPNIEQRRIEEETEASMASNPFAGMTMRQTDDTQDAEGDDEQT